jgi:hypothetical protein
MAAQWQSNDRMYEVLYMEILSGIGRRIPVRLLLSAGVALPLVLAGTVAAQTADPAPQSVAETHLTEHPHHPAKPSSLPAPMLIGDAVTRLVRQYSGRPIDVTTYHYDQKRTGWNQNETDLTPAAVASKSFGLIATLQVDGNVFAQPLLVSGFVMPDSSIHDVLIIATGHNSVYAFDAQTYTILWQVSLGTPQASADVGCFDVRPEYGISSTPVIVRTATNAATIYVVAATEPSPNEFVATLHALNLATGADAIAPSIVAPSATLSDGSKIAFDTKDQWNRVGLAYNQGSLYVAIGSHCDSNEDGITGWLLGYNANLKLQSSFHTIGTRDGNGELELASIWMTGFAPAIDDSGNVYVVTGNGAFNAGQNNWGQSVLKLPPTLNGVTTYFTPSAFAALNAKDTDFGSGGVMLLPAVAGQTAPPLAVAMGKSGVLYLLNRESLGGMQPNDAGALQAQSGGIGGLWGGPAFYNGPSGPTVFTQTTNQALRAWTLNANSTPSLIHSASGNSDGGDGGSLPIVSSNGSLANTGVVWLINRESNPFAIEAYDAVKLGAPIFTAQISLWSNPGHTNVFLTPMEANVRVYAPGFKVVQVYGLTP